MTSSVATDILRSDYGGFNPRFVGVSFQFATLDDYRIWTDYGTGPEVPEPAADPSLHLIALRSVTDHESRHYVDFLLSPYSMTVFRMRLQGLLNGVQALATLRDLEGDVVPVPMTRWATLTDAQRRARGADWADLFGAAVRPVDLPARPHGELLTDLPPSEEAIGHLPAQRQFERYADSAMRAYARIAQLTQGFDVPGSAPYLRPPYLHEVSAYTVQLAAIWRGQGEVEFGRFLGFLLDSTAPQARALQFGLKLARLLEPPTAGSTFESAVLRPLRRIPSIITWALLGSYQLDGPRGCPSSRLMRLLDAVTDAPDPYSWSGDLGDGDAVGSMWDRWDERLGVTSWRVCLTQNVALAHHGVAQYQRVRDRWEGSPDIPDAVVGVLAQVAEDQRLTALNFIRDPSAFVDPFRFIRLPAGSLPIPDFRVEFTGLRVHVDAVAAGRTIERRDRDGRSYAVGVAFAAQQDPAGRARLEQKLTLEQVTEWCDLAFSELSVPDHVHLTARAGLAEMTGKQIVQLV